MLKTPRRENGPKITVNRVLCAAEEKWRAHRLQVFGLAGSVQPHKMYKPVHVHPNNAYHYEVKNMSNTPTGKKTAAESAVRVHAALRETWQWRFAVRLHLVGCMRGCGGCFWRRFPPECTVKGCNSAPRVKRGLKTTPTVGQGRAGRAVGENISGRVSILFLGRDGAAAAADFCANSVPP